ncbi:MAG: hypothetical protein R3C70_00700 [Geminicoccaceae bacterium]
MDDRVRLRIDLGGREIEIEGPESFVEKYATRLEEMMDRLLQDAVAGEMLPAETPAAPPDTGSEEPKRDLGPLGAFLHHLPNSATEVDKMLAAGFYLEQKSPDGTFVTADANRRLAEHGIRIGNASQCVRQSLMAKRVFTFARGRYKVSQDGRRYLDRLMGGAIGS